MSMRSNAPKLPENKAIRLLKRKLSAELRAGRIAEASRRVRDDSMRVNAEFAAIERNPQL